MYIIIIVLIGLVALVAAGFYAFSGHKKVNYNVEQRQSYVQDNRVTYGFYNIGYSMDDDDIKPIDYTKTGL